ncbi:SET and MYND domain containing protein [Rhodotorula toruloides]|uniref:SET and MYND domain containing protein n=1 Tax=Rhodotorula toruloides TaxID=5286 RepID=A0A511KJY4_RHOTO|nr:SET and MYND domain containing protein [Rhodotorula toruloides]
MSTTWAALKAKRAGTSGSVASPSPAAEPETGEEDKRNTDLPSSLEVRHIPGRGRGVVAVEAFGPGSTLLTTTPLVSVLDQCNLRHRCSFCFRSVDDTKSSTAQGGGVAKLQQCSMCHIVQYCSDVCQKRDWSIHKKECKDLQNSTKTASQAHASPPDVVLRALSRLLYLRESDKAGKLWGAIESLESHRTRLSEKEQEDFFRLSISFASYVGQKRLKEACPNAAAVLDLCSRFTSNSFSLTSPADLSNIGVSISPATALINHSCHPNAVIVFPSFPSSTSTSPSRYMSVVAIRPIDCGEEIVTSYVDLALTKKLRQKELRERYKFDFSTVTCSACGTSAPYNDVYPALEAAKLAYEDAERVQREDERTAAIQLQHIIDSLTTSLAPSPPLAPSAYPLFSARQLLLALHLDAHRFDEAVDTACAALLGSDIIYHFGHPVRAVLRTTHARLRTVPPDAPPEDGDAQLKWWIDLEARQKGRQLLAAAHEEVVTAFGTARIEGSPVPGGEMGKLLADLIEDQDRGIRFSSIVAAERLEKDA